MIKWIKPSGAEIETNDSKACLEIATSLGWKRLIGEKTKAESKGYGDPGTVKWHKSALNGMNSKDDMCSHTHDVCGYNIDKRGSLEKVRDKCLAQIEYHIKSRAG